MDKDCTATVATAITEIQNAPAIYQKGIQTKPLAA